MNLAGRLAVASLLLALAACDGDPNGPAQTQNAVRITYAGTGIGGSYVAQGALQAGTPPLQQTYAQGRRYPVAGALEVLSTQTRSSTTADFAWLDIPQVTTGTLAIDPDCDADHCPAVSLALEVGTTGVSQARLSCFLRQGSITVSAISDTRVRGTFSGTGHCLGAPGTANVEDFAITSGSFDVPLVDLQG